MKIIKYLKLPFYFDFIRLQKEVEELGTDCWQAHYQKLHYEGGWSAIPLRSIGGKVDDIFISPHENPVYQNTAFLKSHSYFSEVLSNFKCELQSVRLLKLDAGALIKEHKDAELSYEQESIRIHIPVITNDDVEFFLDNEKMKLKEGECWYMNFNLPHHLHNKSNFDRIHLVIDAVVNKWVSNIFNEPSPFKKEIENPSFDLTSKQKIIAELRNMNSETSNRLANEMQTTLEKKTL